MSIPLAGQADLEEWLSNHLPSRRHPHTDIMVRDYHFRPWIIWQNDFDEWVATSYPLPEEDLKDCIGVPLDRLTYSVTVLG